MTKKKSSQTAKPAILAVAVSMARNKGLEKLSRVQIAAAAEVAQSTISYHFGQMPALRSAVVRYAVEHEILSILADARASRESIGVPMSEELRQKVAAYIAS